jgi:trk system potassium uptake protein TrkA
MNVIICGAGEVGTYCAEVLARDGHNITVIDARPERLRQIEETMDVRILQGNCANADLLREAGAADREAALVAATNSDEINLLTAAVAKGVGIGRVCARVHHSAYFEQRGLDYKTHFGIDRLICPEFSTAQAVASTLRNPAALAIEMFASGQIETQEFPLSPGAEAIGKSLAELPLPQGVRLAAIRRAGTAFLPSAATVIEADDGVILVGNTDVIGSARKLFQRSDPGRQRLVVMGGSSLSVWLCRALQERAFSIRLFEPDRARAEELAEKLDWVTVLNADATDVAVFEEEGIAEADAFVGATYDEEHNILACAWAKAAGVGHVIGIVQRRRYLHVVERINIDHAFSPRVVAVRQIERAINDAPMLQMASLAEGVIDVYRVKVRATAEAVGKPLRKLPLSPDWMVAAISHDGHVRVPSADDFIHAGDAVMVIGRHGAESKLKQIFAVK